MSNRSEGPEWYDFVPLPPHKKIAPGAGDVTHRTHLSDRFTGYLELTFEAESPIHVGSGVAELSEDAGQEAGSVVKGMAHVAGRPVIPATSLKGALRANYETITHSCLGPVRPQAKETYSRDFRRSRLPQALIDQLPSELQQLAAEDRSQAAQARRRRERPSKKSPEIEVEVDPDAIEAWRRCELSGDGDATAGLCPACALFGTEGLQGRVSFDDAKVVGDLPPRQPLRLASLYEPRLHRAGNLRIQRRGRRSVVQVQKIRGRKAYYHVNLGDVPAKGNVPVDYLPQGTRLKTDLHFRNVSLAELGGLLTALSLDPDRSFPFRVGGGKPLGLGYLKLKLDGIHLEGHASSLLDFDAGPQEPLTKEDCLQAFQESKGQLYFERGLRALCAITWRPYKPGQRRYGR